METLISGLDAATEILRQASTRLKRYRQAVLKAAVEGELSREWRATGQAVESEPAEWIPLGSVADVIDPQPSHRTPPVSAEGVPYVGMSDVDADGSVNLANARVVSAAVWDEHRSRYTLREGDFFIGKIGTIGRPVRVPHSAPLTLSANVILIQPRQGLYRDYLYYVLGSPTIERAMKAGSVATTQAAFGIQKARKLMVPVPSMQEQEVIVSETERILSVIDFISNVCARELRRSGRLRQTILEKAFRGELVPQDPNDEPASVLLERIRAQRAEATSSGKKVRSARVKPAPVGVGA